MKLQQAELKNLIEKHASKEGGSSTAVPCLRFFCATAPSEFLHTLYEPSLCIIAQGLQSGRYDLNNVAIGITQTGGQISLLAYFKPKSIEV
jgi:hypothetical protein